MDRQALTLLIDELRPHDPRESADRATALQWIESDAPLYRIQKPDIPPMHLVSYFAIVDPSSNKILLQDHLLAKLWLPAGGHVDPDEDPADTVRRECVEELGIEASFLGNAAPHFITVTKTQGQGEHTDVSLWYTLQASENKRLIVEPDRFAEVRWWDIDDVLAAPITMFDPELHRFLNKLKVRGVIS
jgi:8-oxo-dGTP pyrophosphatase MutT (NUDIX family)